jgi:hypothetical protein
MHVCDSTTVTYKQYNLKAKSQQEGKPKKVILLVDLQLGKKQQNSEKAMT